MKICRAMRIFTVVLTLFAGLPAVAQTFTTLYSFTGTPDGANPFQSDLLNVNGTLYGTTGAGGAFGSGTIFTFSSTGKEKVIYSFTGGADGYEPSSGLIRDRKGNFYGTTFFGGDPNCPDNFGKVPGCGTVYKLDSSNNLSVLYTFTGSTDGAGPQGLVMDSAGNLYGVAFYGGNLSCPLLPGIGCGVVFKISSTTGNFAPLYTFQGGADGGIPFGFLTLHGTAVYGGTQDGGNLSDCGGAGCGVIFAVSTSTGAEKSLYAFTGGADGGFPTSQFLFDSAGNLYGTTYAGGDLSCSNQNSVGCGVVFRLTPAGKETAIYAFKGMPDAANPSWGLTADASGNGYGTALYGGASNLGAVFKISSKGVESVLHSFSGTDGSYPESGLVGIGTAFYSNSAQGGNLSCNSPNGCGTIFKITP